jgi:redox-sensitive bicupin YhaK (pirin superfamily)
MYRSVTNLIPAYDINMGGIIVKQALPTQKINQVDPFLLLHHGIFKFHKNAPAIQQGIGPHPHRGFTPVTFVIEGEVHHRDSFGHNQIAKKGEVQWMHTGAGITHSERPSQASVDAGIDQEIIQLWINSPAAKKMKPPTYQYFKEDDFYSYLSNDGAIKCKLIAGSIDNNESKIQTESPLLIAWSIAHNDGVITHKVPQNYNSMIYLIRGNIKISGYGIVEAKTLIVFDNDSELIKITASKDTQYLILSGEPINEKVVQQGPFVMNSETEILKAMRDYQMGKMGILIEE